MNPKENKLGSMPIGRLLISMSIPMMISFFIQALYNIVDSMFVAKISEDALTAVSIAFPLQQVITATAVGTGVGVNALVPRYVGQGELHLARRISNVAVFLSVCYTLVFGIIGMTAIRSFYTMQTDVPTIIEAGTQYLTIVCTISVGAFFGQNFEKLLVATGNTLCSMSAQATGAIFNIIFDPLLIFGIGPFPAMGVRGAAVATVAGQIVAAIVAFFMLRWKEKNIRLSFRYMLPPISVLKNIFSIAIPSMITVGLTSAMSFSMNQILLGFSTTATAVFGIWLKLQNFSYMPIFGMNNGTIPMISFNYGANRMDRVRQTIRLALKVAIILMLLLTVLFECIPGILLTMFSASENMIAIGTTAIRLLVLSLPLGAICLTLSSSFQSLGHSRYTLYVNLSRQLVLLIPIAYAMSLTGSLTPIWASVAISEGLTVLMTLSLHKKLKGKVGL